MYAIEMYEQTKADPYDKVFVVFDKDAHTTYDEALKKIEALNEKRKYKDSFEAIVSVPCFEFWLLLHFECAMRPYASTGNKSICENVICDLKKYIPNYDKGNDDVFKLTCPNVDTAIANAKMIEKRQRNNATDNPITMAYKLVEYLFKISEANTSSPKKRHGNTG